jgi:hypothetical protein
MMSLKILTQILTYNIIKTKDYDGTEFFYSCKIFNNNEKRLEILKTLI